MSRVAPTSLFGPWLAWAAACLAAMSMWPGEETVPYHLGYAGLAIAFGLDTWSNRRAYLALAGFTVATGAVLVDRAAAGVIAWEETTEIPLMCLLMALMVWHVGRRHAALAHVTELARRDHEQAVRRERMVRLASHEMRTPLAIAMGHVDLLRTAVREPRDADDLVVVHEELDRISRGCDRLLRMIRFHEEMSGGEVDLDALVASLVSRWGVVAPRAWRADASAGSVPGGEERLRACLDTLVENALRYTRDGDAIRVFAHRDGDAVVLGVGDGGAGFSPAQISAINGCVDLGPADPLLADARSQTGLGLSLVQQVVASRGGDVRAGRAPEGGALVTLRIPAPPSPRGRRLAARSSEPVTEKARERVVMPQIGGTAGYRVAR